MTTISLPDLQTEFPGGVIGPDDAEYDGARALFYGGLDHRPAVIIRPPDPTGVAAVIGLASASGLDLSVRSGGHSIAGRSVSDGGIMLDLSRLRALAVDADEGTAWAQTGLTGGDVTATAAEHGLAVGFGDTGSVGIGGITTGGGVGFLSRKRGLTIDSVLAAEVVTADGQILHVDDTHHPDLFWAVRGGGGNFGVVTRFQYRLHELPGVVAGPLILPATVDVVHGFLTEALSAPDELSVIVNVMTAPPMPFIPAQLHGQLVVLGLVCYAGPADDADRVLAPLRALAEPLADLVRPVGYAELFPIEEVGDFHPIFASRTQYADQIDRAVVEHVLRQLQDSPAPMRAVQFRPLGGAVDRVPANATAYAHRGRPCMVNVAAMVERPDARAEREEWVANLGSTIQDGEPAAYVNFLGADGAARIREAYPGATWDRLVAVKRRYDPQNLFRLNANIDPAGDG